jgi:hypothetical protein
MPSTKIFFNAHAILGKICLEKAVKKANLSITYLSVNAMAPLYGKFPSSKHTRNSFFRLKPKKAIE